MEIPDIIVYLGTFVLTLISSHPCYHFYFDPRHSDHLDVSVCTSGSLDRI